MAVPLGATQRRGPIGRGVYDEQREYANSRPKKARKTPRNIKENYDGEYDDESGMAKTNLHTMLRAVKGLHKAIADGENLPEWVQEKIAGAKMNLVSVWDYILSQHEQGIQPMQESRSKR